MGRWCPTDRWQDRGTTRRESDEELGGAPRARLGPRTSGARCVSTRHPADGECGLAGHHEGAFELPSRDHRAPASPLRQWHGSRLVHGRDSIPGTAAAISRPLCLPFCVSSNPAYYLPPCWTPLWREPEDDWVAKMPVEDNALWKDWLNAEKTLGEARDQLRTVEHLDLGDREFQEAWQAYRLALDVFNAITNKL
jgi:hypothetical protein